MPINNVKQGFEEFKKGDLHSGKGGPKVKDKKQAIAIILTIAKKNKLPKK